jgi:hypothetical protein
VERAFEADDVDPLGLAVGEMVFARRLQGALDGLGPGVGEEADVGETDLAEPFGQRLLLGDAEDVGDVPELVALRLQGVGQGRVVVPKGVDGDAGEAIEVFLTRISVEANALAARGRTRPSDGLQGRSSPRRD